MHTINKHNPIEPQIIAISFQLMIVGHNSLGESFAHFKCSVLPEVVTELL